MPLCSSLLTPLRWFAEGVSDTETQRLEDEVEDAAKKLVDDIDLFGEMDGDGGAQ